jgi:hypothetical protein
MLRKFVCAAVALVLVTGIALAEEKKGKGGKKRTGTFGKITKIDATMGTLTVLVKKSREDEGTSTDFTLTKNTKFQVSNGRGKEPTVVTSKDEIKEKFKEGTRVRLGLDEDGKTVKTVSTFGPRKPKKDK